MRHLLLLALVFYVFVTILAQQIPYFWDNVALISNPAQFYYHTYCQKLVLPLLLDTGHPPFYAYYIAHLWQYFNKTIAVWHWANLPFLVGIAWAYLGLARYFLNTQTNANLPNHLLFFCLLFLFTEPTLLTQTTLATPDVALVCGSLVALYGIVSQKTIVLSAGLCLMAAVSLRGVIHIPAVFLCHFVYVFTSKLPLKTKHKLTFLLAYLPVTILLFIWLVYHHQQTGFWLENYQSNWAINYHAPTIQGALYNWCILAWRFLDQGRLFIWLIIAWLGYKNKHFTALSLPQKQLIAWFLVWLMISGLPVSFRAIPIMHRYYIVHYLLVLLFACTLLTTLKPTQQRLFVGLMLIAQITGHLWIYPQPIATDWDATLASMPYFTLKKQADIYLQQQKIPKTAVGSKFPLINSPQQTHLNNDTTHLQRIDEGQISRFEYVLYSNISNDFSATEITQLQTHWQVQQQWSKGFVQLVLYKNKQ